MDESLRKNLRDTLEPGACDSATHIDNIDMIHLSTAISLKRIADVLDGTAVGLNVSETFFGQRRD